MALRTKFSYVETVLTELRAQFIGRDLQLDPRDVLLKMDSIVNESAKAGLLQNWKMNLGGGIDDQFITDFTPLTVTDPVNKGASFVQIPAHYGALQDNLGIDQVYFVNSFTTPKRKYFDPVLIVSFKDISSYRNTIGADLEERISCYPKGGYLYFDRGEINLKYGPIGIRQFVRDSGAIADDAPYPISATEESMIMNQLIQFYRLRLAQQGDLIKDAEDAPQNPPVRRISNDAL